VIPNFLLNMKPTVYKDLDKLSSWRAIPGQIKSVVGITVVLVILFMILGHFIKKVDPTKKTPMWLVPWILLVELINNFTKTNIGKRWKSYAPYFLALGIYLFVANTCSVFAMDNPTSYICVNAALAIITFFIVQITGLVSLGIKEYLKSFVGPVKAMSFIMIPMNIISEFTLPISLTLRLLGNIVSGLVISLLIKGMLGLIAIPVMPFINGVFDIFFGAIQAFIFVVLTIIFTSMKVDDKEKIYS